jgi:hypothetical protein
LISHLILLALPLPPFVGEENLLGGVSAGDNGGELADIEYELNEGDSDNCWRKKKHKNNKNVVEVMNNRRT